MSATWVAERAAPEDGGVYWVFLRDKGVAGSRLGVALDLRRGELAPRALRRRRRVRGDGGVDQRDLPVYRPYVSRIEATGARLRTTSRWLDAVSVEATAAQMGRIAALPFVAEIRPVARARRRVVPAAEGDGGGRSFDDPAAQLGALGVPALHACGLTGAGVVIGVQDTGFSLDHAALRDVDVVGARDFIGDDEVVSDEPGDPEGQDGHGTRVLSLVAGRDGDAFTGAAPGVSVLLSKTEDTSQEEPIEEDWFVAGMEWIEAMGADVMTSSLGYTDWYDPADMDGQTAVTSLASAVALENGLILVSSAGNHGPDPTTITAPADTDGLVATGAVTAFGAVAGFSSRGPTADGRIKPDVCAPGVEVWMADPETEDGYRTGSGTSYAAPLVAGVIALLLEADPTLDPWEMHSLLTSTAAAADAPDDDCGWGLVRAVAAVGGACPCLDYDGDGFLDAACGGEDCDDFRAAVHPGADEVCDGFDGDCDGALLPGEEDADADGYLACDGDPDRRDCDDLAADVHPGAWDQPYDGVDQDCDGADLVDVDGDGVPGPEEDCDDEDARSHPGAVELCGDGADNDCDGDTDGEDADCALGGVQSTTEVTCRCGSAPPEARGTPDPWAALALALALARRRSRTRLRGAR